MEAVAVSRLSAEFTEMAIDPLETVISDISRLFVENVVQLEGGVSMESVPEAQNISGVGATTDEKEDAMDRLSDLREMFNSLMTELRKYWTPTNQGNSVSTDV